MPAHELGIKCVEARDGVVMTGSLDMSLKLWDASSFKSVATLDCVGDSVMDLEIIAGSWLLAAGVLSYLLSRGGRRKGGKGGRKGKKREAREEEEDEMPFKLWRPPSVCISRAWHVCTQLSHLCFS